MDKNQIKDYILKYKKDFSREQIATQLKNSGANQYDIDRVYLDIESNGKKSNTGLIIFLVVIVLFLAMIPILGVLFFSFVDFGSTLPNKIDLRDSNIQPIVSDSFASVDGTFIMAFKYNGVRPINFYYDENGKYEITYNYADSSCTSISKIYNSNTKLEATNINESVIFRNGHPGYIEFKNCDGFEDVSALDGNIKISYISSQTGSETPVFGEIRFAIQ